MTPAMPRFLHPFARLAVASVGSYFFPMDADSLRRCVEALVQAFPIEDIWLLDDETLDVGRTLLAIVPDDQEAFSIEREAARIVSREMEGVEISVFPQSAIERLPRPLIVKLALSRGKKIFCA